MNNEDKSIHGKDWGFTIKQGIVVISSKDNIREEIKDVYLEKETFEKMIKFYKEYK